MHAIQFDPEDPAIQRIRAYTAFSELGRAAELGHLTRAGLDNARCRLVTANEWPNLDLDLDALRIRTLEHVCRIIARGNTDLLGHYAAQGWIFDAESLPDDLAALDDGPRPEPPLPTPGVSS